VLTGFKYNFCIRIFEYSTTALLLTPVPHHSLPYVTF